MGKLYSYLKPRAGVGLYVGEEDVFTIDITDELGSDTVDTPTLTITNSSGADVTSNYGGGISESSGTLTIGVKGYAAGTFNINLDITCNETLPDGTARNFQLPEMALIVKANS